MSTNIERIKKLLQVDEPDYDKLSSELGPSDLQSLDILSNDEDPLLASKATYLIGLVSSKNVANIEEGISSIKKAAVNDKVEVRIAAASATGTIITSVGNVADTDDLRELVGVLETLSSDQDVGVTKQVTKIMDSNADIISKIPKDGKLKGSN